MVSAYDFVRLDLLEARVREEKVLDEQQIALWKYLCAHRTVRVGDEIVAASNGVPQGSTASPGMWNVYSNGIIKQLATFRPEKLVPAAVADDTVTIATSWWLARESARIY